MRPENAVKGEKWRMFVCLWLYPLPLPSFRRFRFLRASSAQLFTTTTNRAFQHTHAPFLVFRLSWLKQYPQMRIHIFTAFLLVINVAASHSSPLNSHARKSFNGVKRQLLSDVLSGALDGLGLGGKSACQCKWLGSLPCF